MKNTKIALVIKVIWCAQIKEEKNKNQLQIGEFGQITELDKVFGKMTFDQHLKKSKNKKREKTFKIF